MDRWTTYESPLGRLTIVAGERGLRSVRFPGRGAALDERAHATTPLLDDVVAQLEQYFAGDRLEFEIPLDLGGTPFQRAVWARLVRIPYGQTTSYGALADAIGRPDRVRAVGATVGRTPVPIIVPCHRVIGADGSLTGYGGGLHRKRALLELEARGAAEPAWAFRQLALI
jgi:methylated-DNA-[protein]-cysteine S-methyltransferase